jgi:hypothetical protein
MKLIHFFRRLLGINLLSEKVSRLENSIIDKLDERLPNRQSAEFFHETQDLLAHARALQYIALLKTKQVVGKNFLRFGSVFDGGYLLVDDLAKTDFVISGGIGENCSFDESVAPSVGKVVLIDDSISTVNLMSVNYEFLPLKLSSKLEENSIQITSLLNMHEEYSDAILKMDIEGAEWNILAELKSSDFLRFRQIALELHSLSDVYNDDFHRIKIKALENLARNHELISISANNYGEYRVIGGVPVPDVLEVTYVRRNSYLFEDGYSLEVSNLESLNNPVKPKYLVWWK